VRATAIAASPLLLVLPVLLAVFAGGFGVALLILGLPGAMAYGGLVRLPRGETTELPGRANPA
jgi:hypothetical protein